MPILHFENTSFEAVLRKTGTRATKIQQCSGNKKLAIFIKETSLNFVAHRSVQRTQSTFEKTSKSVQILCDIKLKSYKALVSLSWLH